MSAMAFRSLLSKYLQAVVDSFRLGAVPGLAAGLAGAAAVFPAAAAAEEGVLVPRVVVVTMFEVGAPQGDRPGEFQFWVERLPLDEEIPFAAGHSNLRFNRQLGILGLVTGGGGPEAASSVLALGLDPRFDLSKSYWLVAGIAGVDPLDASPGSAAWARWVVDGDLMYSVDEREIPDDWPYGKVALGARKPGEPGNAPWAPPIAVALNARLTEWAYGITRDVALLDTEAVAKLRSRYAGFPAAQAGPHVLLGESLCSSTYWHGARSSLWANDWVRQWTGGAGNYVMTAMEDQGTVAALRRLDKAGRADLQRLLVLRTASNFDQPPPGVPPTETIGGDYAGFLPALEAAYRVGSVVVHALVKGDPELSER